MKAPGYHSFAAAALAVVCLSFFCQKTAAQQSPPTSPTPVPSATVTTAIRDPSGTTLIVTEKRKLKSSARVTLAAPLSFEELGAGYQEFVSELRQRKTISANFIKGKDRMMKLNNGQTLGTYYLNVQQAHNDFTKGISDLIRKKRRAPDNRVDQWAKVENKFITLVNTIRANSSQPRTLCIKCLKIWYKSAQAYWMSADVTDSAGLAEFFLSEVTW